MAPQPRSKVRRDFFVSCFADILRALPEVYSGQTLDQPDADSLAGAYFLLSDGYKKWRVHEGHNTNDYKKAGITIAAMMAVRPFRPKSTDDRLAFFANQFFGMFCAIAILGKPITGITSARDQFYAWLDTLRFPSLSGFLEERELGLGEFVDDGQGINLTPQEVSQIDMICEYIKRACSDFDDTQRLDSEDSEP